MSGFNSMEAASMAYYKIQVEMEAEKRGISHPKDSKAVKVLKGVVTGVGIASGMAFGCASSYYTASMLYAIVPWDQMTSKPVEIASKVGIIGMSTATGTAVSKVFMDTGDAVNDFIDSMADATFMAKVRKAIEADMPAEDEAEEE